MHWIQSVNPHFYVTLYYNGSPYISFSVEVAVDKYVDKEGNEKEKLIELRFIDSFKFTASSLDFLTRNLVGACAPPSSGSKGEKLFGFKNYSELQYELLTRKGVYPYEYMSSWDKFKEFLPPIEAFYSKLNMSKIDEDDYQHAQRVWEEFWNPKSRRLSRSLFQNRCGPAGKCV